MSKKYLSIALAIVSVVTGAICLYGLLLHQYSLGFVAGGLIFSLIILMIIYVDLQQREEREAKLNELLHQDPNQLFNDNLDAINKIDQEAQKGGGNVG